MVNDNAFGGSGGRLNGPPGISDDLKFRVAELADGVLAAREGGHSEAAERIERTLFDVLVSECRGVVLVFGGIALWAGIATPDRRVEFRETVEI